MLEEHENEIGCLFGNMDIMNVPYIVCVSFQILYLKLIETFKQTCVFGGPQVIKGMRVWKIQGSSPYNKVKKNNNNNFYFLLVHGQ